MSCDPINLRPICYGLRYSRGPILCNRRPALKELLVKQILWTFQKFWNQCFGSYRNSVYFPEILEWMFWVLQKYFVVLEILDQCFGSYRNSVDVPEILLESMFWVQQKFCGRSRNSGINFILERTKYSTWYLYRKGR
jgi:hypothetical protein